MIERLRTTSALAVVVMILVGACGSSASPTPAASAPAASGPAASAPAASGPAASGPAASAPAAANLPAVPTGYKELDQALTTKDFNGKKVSIQTQWTGGEGTGFAAAIADFAKASGITIQVDSIGSSHETVLKTRIAGGSPPDMAALAQPTGVLAYAADSKVKDIAAIVGPEGTAKLKAEFPSTIGLTSEGDHIWSIPTKADVKSMIWYPVKAFAAKGYAVPKTWDELVTLADKIKADGSHPFCVSAGGPGTATGWELTDWVEEVLLKTEDPQVTNDWISHKINFTDPKIKAAFDKVGSLLFKDGYVDGGGQAIVNADLKTVMDPMFTQDTAAPGCWMQKIPVWYGPDFFPDKRTSGGATSKYVIGDSGDIGIFPFPTISDSFKGAEGSADSFMVLNDRPEVRAVAEFLATPEGLEGWIKGVGVLSPNVKVPAEWYAGNYKLKVANDIASGATAIGFDASDLMPPAVGQGSFWTGISDWANSNGSNTDTVLKAIDDSWPK
ncbi:MAG TPA: ABC transporter substrate-binding protein [Candidatus Limnocylindrales bacterium]|nr:ABC transporter substrate-binding protein [Candidatus Limnocylindrales bacterium]